MIYEAGFTNVKYENLTFGVVAIHDGFKIWTGFFGILRFLDTALLYIYKWWIWRKKYARIFLIFVR